MSVTKLKSFIKKNSKAKAAVILGLKDTSTITNWIARNEIPEKYKDDVRFLAKRKVVVMGTD